MNLTARQQSVLDYLRAYIAEHGRPPTLREIGDGVGVSFARARRLLLVLRDKGAIRYDGGVRAPVPTGGSQD